MDAKYNLVGLTCGVLIAVSILTKLLDVQVPLDAAALGATTTPVFAKRNEHRIHLDDLADLPQLSAAVEEFEHGNLIFWLGNSQLHAINQYESGQVNAVSHAHNRLYRDAGDLLLSVSFPNANLQEHLLAFEAFCSSIGVPDLLLLPVVFDDLREDGIRSGLDRWATDHLSELPVFAQSGFAGSDDPDVTDGTKAIRETPVQTLQDRSEAALDSTLSSVSTTWRERANLRGSVFLRLYHFRNRVFGIDSQTARRLIPDRYRKNMSALDTILSCAQTVGTPVVVYVPPLRDDVTRPYIASEYADFLEDLRQRVDRTQNARLVDFERIVPGDLWGSTGATDGSDKVEYDFMHFREAGHELLADQILDVVAETIGQSQ